MRRLDYVVGLGDLYVSQQKDTKLLTFGLASCVGVTLYHGGKQVAGMIHVVLPSPINLEHQEAHKKGYFATTGLPRLIGEMTKYGCPVSELIARVYGGAVQSGPDLFQIGQRNSEAVLKILREMGLRIQAVDVGGTESRTLLFDVDTGQVLVKTQALLT